jgi:hypothetical protein
VSTAARTRCLLSLCALLLALGPLPTHAATPEETTRARELGQEAAELFRALVEGVQGRGDFGGAAR